MNAPISCFLYQRMKQCWLTFKKIWKGVSSGNLLCLLGPDSFSSRRTVHKDPLLIPRYPLSIARSRGSSNYWAVSVECPWGLHGRKCWPGKVPIGPKGSSNYVPKFLMLDYKSNKISDGRKLYILYKLCNHCDLFAQRNKVSVTTLTSSALSLWQKLIHQGALVSLLYFPGAPFSGGTSSFLRDFACIWKKCPHPWTGDNPWVSIIKISCFFKVLVSVYPELLSSHVTPQSPYLEGSKYLRLANFYSSSLFSSPDFSLLCSSPPSSRS